MSEKKPDKRVLKTKRALCEGLAELLTDKELRKITVQEIADKADVNRVTFYKHYLDVYDLYEKLENEVIIDLGILVLDAEKGPTEDYNSSLIDYIDSNRKVFSMIFSPYNTGQLRDKVEKMFAGLYLQIYMEKFGIKKKTKEVEYVSYYHSSGCIAIIEKWVRSGYDGSKESIIKIISDMDKNFEKTGDYTK